MDGATARGPGREIRVLLVDDSPLSIEIVRSMLASAPEIMVVGTAGDGVRALELIPEIRPDVICTDLHMPRMNGLELIHAVMARHPLPILVLSVSVQEDQKDSIFQMLEAGALDILAKPRGGLNSNFDVVAHDLVTKIRVLAGVKVIARRRPAQALPARRVLPRSPVAAACAPRIAGIGASTGGPQALTAVLGHLPADFPIPVVCVQHIAEGFMQGLVAWLADTCRIRVRTAQEDMQPAAGTAYFPPDGHHLEIDDRGRFRCSGALPLGGHRPSIDLALGSLARHYGAGAVGVLLTGMGVDGAQGLADIAHAGGLTIAQDEQSCAVFGMPQRAIELGAARHVLPLHQIGPALCEAVHADAALGQAGSPGARARTG